jgi:hypothetical protein
MMMTWGISDFTDANGDSDGKFSISLNFPNDEYRTEQTDLFLQKMKDFENQILDDAVKMAETWWGEPMSREICKHTFFPILKYSKNKDTHKVDYSKPPSFRAKVPVYDGNWKVEVYDTKGEMIFPSSNPDETPDKLITKLSSVACGIQSGGIWIGGKGWGVTWKLVQCMVKPKEVVSITGRCFLSIPREEQQPAIAPAEVIKPAPLVVAPVVINKPKAVEAPAPAPVEPPVASSTEAEDTDDEADEPIQMVIESKEEEPPAEVPPPAPVKKVIKKTPAPVPVVPVPVPMPVPMPVPVTESSGSTAEPLKKKVVKKATPPV